MFRRWHLVYLFCNEGTKEMAYMSVRAKSVLSTEAAASIASIDQRQFWHKKHGILRGYFKAQGCVSNDVISNIFFCEHCVMSTA